MIEWIKVIVLIPAGCLFILLYHLLNAKAEVVSRRDSVEAQIYGIEDDSHYFRYFLKYCDNGKEKTIKSVRYDGMKLTYQEGDTVTVSIVTYDGGTQWAEICGEEASPLSEGNNKGTIVLLILGIMAILLSLGLAIRILI